MYNTSDNPQVEYSLNALSDALFSLMRIKYYSEITVSEICEKAQITRRTFYRNCDNKRDLADYKIIRAIRSQLEDVDFNCENTDYLYTHFFEYWLKNRSLLETLYKQDLFERFQHCFVYVCVNELNYPFLENFLSGKKEHRRLRLFHNAFTVGGLCGILELWTRDGFKAPVSDLVNVTTALAPTP